MQSPDIVQVRIGDLEVACRLEGPQDAPVIMFSNSLMADFSMWDANIAAFTDRYRVLRYDTRGHGGTVGPPGACTISDLVDDVVGLLDALEIPRVHFVGLSLGGIIGQRLGASFPERLHSLTLCDTSSDNSAARAGWHERIAAVRNNGIGLVVEPTLQRWFTPAFLNDAPQRVEAIRRMMSRIDAEGYMRCAAAIAEMVQTDLLSAIVARTLILVGRKDMACTVEQALGIQSHIPGAALVVIEDAAHLPNVEQAVAFNAAVRTFIDA